MANLQQIMQRAQALRQETALDSISPERAGGIMYDTLSYINQMQLQDANPILLSKIYSSVEAMQADTAPVSDITGKALRPGQVVVIVTSSTSSQDYGVVYRYNGTVDGASSWTAVGKIGSSPYLEGYLYAGIATPATDPQTANITQRVFYRAVEPGTYTNFGGIVVNSGEVVNLKFGGSSWSKEVTGEASAASVTELGQKVNRFRLSDLEFINAVGLTANTGWVINAKVISSLFILKTADFVNADGKLVFYDGRGASSTIFYAVLFFDSSFAPKERVGYSATTSISADPSTRPYFAIALGLQQGGSDIGGNKADYGLENVYIYSNSVNPFTENQLEISLDRFEIERVDNYTIRFGGNRNKIADYNCGGFLMLINKSPSTDIVRVSVKFYDADGVLVSTQALTEQLRIKIPSGAVYFELNLRLLTNGFVYISIGDNFSLFPADMVFIKKNGLDNVGIVSAAVDGLKKVVYKANDLLALTYTQGTIYNNTLEPSNTKCISCEDYFRVPDVLNITNEKQQDGKYWEIRVTFCDANKVFISQYGYAFIDGDTNISIPAGAVYMRFSISLTNADGTDADCTPASIPTDGTEILYATNNIEQLMEEVADISKVVSKYTPPSPLPLSHLLGYGLEHAFNMVSGYGGCACYNGVLFQFRDGNQYVYVYDVATGTLLQTITMSNPSADYHNNSVCFGAEKYDAGDAFPLLYASQEKASENKCIVYRITGTSGNYSLSVVQTITYPANSATKLYYHNCYIDAQNNRLVLSGLVNSSWHPNNTNILKYLVFPLPALNDGNVTLQMSDVTLSSPEFSAMPTTQGGVIRSGFLYQVFGVNAPQTMMIYDIMNAKFCYVYNITDEDFTLEPEGTFIYDNELYIVFANAAVYKFARI